MWEHKLKITKRALKKWIKEPSNSPTSNRKETIQFLSDLQIDLESKEISASDLETEQAAQTKSFRSFCHEEETLRLKSRSLWLKARD